MNLDRYFVLTEFNELLNSSSMIYCFFFPSSSLKDICEVYMKYDVKYIFHIYLTSRRGSRGSEMGEFSPPLFLSPLLSFFFSYP